MSLRVLWLYCFTIPRRTSERKKHNAKKVVLFFNPFFNAHNLQLLCGSNGLRLCYYLRCPSPESRARYAEMHFTPLRRAFVHEFFARELFRFLGFQSRTTLVLCPACPARSLPLFFSSTFCNFHETAPHRGELAVSI